MVAAFACALVPAPASAEVDTAGGISYVSKRVEALFDDHTVITRCPAGTHVASGGQSNGVGFNTARQIHSYPVDDESDNDRRPDDGWATRVLTTAATDFTFYAICVPIPVTYEKEKVTPPPFGDQSGEDAKCRRHMDAVGGGMKGDFNVFQVSTFALGGTEWTNHFTSYYNGTRKLTLYASCVDVHTRMFSADIQVAPSSQDDATAECNHNKRHVYGGGVVTAGLPGETTINSTFPIAPEGGGSAPDDGWRSYEDNFDDEENLLISYVLCGPALN